MGILERIAQGEILVSDGAMGTMLQAQGLATGECPESWCISHPHAVRTIAQAYFAAGADIVETNSFGATAMKLQGYRLADQATEINRAAAALARQAAPQAGYVAASVGPTGHLAEEEGGTASASDLYATFREQVVALAEAGADAICIETMMSLAEAEQAIRAARENTSLPVICTFSFEARRTGFRTPMGVTPEQAALASVAAGAHIVGANCGNGIANMVQIARQMRLVAPHTPIMIQANAGLPVVQEGKTVYQETPEYMAAQIPELIAAGANIIGGCCGTTPAHIAAIAAKVRSMGRQVALGAGS